MTEADGGYAPKGFTMATALAAGKRFRLELIFALGKVALTLAKYAPLEKVATIHFASFAYIDSLPGVKQLRSYLLFTSVFDGAPGAYLTDFGTLVPGEIDQIWTACVGYPGARSGDPFVQWLGDHQIENVYFYSGYDGETVPDVQHAIALRKRVADFIAGGNGPSLRARFRKLLRDTQDLLG